MYGVKVNDVLMLIGQALNTATEQKTGVSDQIDSHELTRQLAELDDLGLQLAQLIDTEWGQVSCLAKDAAEQLKPLLAQELDVAAFVRAKLSRLSAFTPIQRLASPLIDSPSFVDGEQRPSKELGIKQRLGPAWQARRLQYRNQIVLARRQAVEASLSTQKLVERFGPGLATQLVISLEAMDATVQRMLGIIDCNRADFAQRITSVGGNEDPAAYLAMLELVQTSTFGPPWEAPELAEFLPNAPASDQEDWRKDLFAA